MYCLDICGIIKTLNGKEDKYISTLKNKYVNFIVLGEKTGKIPLESIEPGDLILLMEELEDEGFECNVERNYLVIK